MINCCGGQTIGLFGSWSYTTLLPTNYISVSSISPISLIYTFDALWPSDWIFYYCAFFARFTQRSTATEYVDTCPATAISIGRWPRPPPLPTRTHPGSTPELKQTRKQITNKYLYWSNNYAIQFYGDNYESGFHKFVCCKFTTIIPGGFLVLRDEI